MLLAVMAGAAEAETRTLKLYNVHTKERADITYKRNGRYLSEGLKKANWLLRDWRRKEPTKMDPRLLDLVWAAYQKSGSRDYIHIISGYRSPATNAMLRRTRGGQAEKSQHMLGKALDFYLPDVSLRKLRDVGLKMQVGGVGYYPKSGSPFVHLDVGGVRHWPRMNRKQLMAVFPDGKSMHIPSDGKPLPRYQQAVAEYNSRKKSGGAITVASASASSSADDKSPGDKKTLLSALFGGGADEEEENSAGFESKPAPAAAPRQVVKAAPAPEPEPQPAPEPETVIASLPTRNIPIPAFAPREAPVVAAPMPIATPEIVAEPQPLPAVQQAAPLPSGDLPLPTEPRVPIPGAPVPPAAIPGVPVPEQDVPVAAEQPQPVAVAALVPVPTLRPTDAPLSARLPESDAAVLAALQARDAGTGAVPQAPAGSSEAQAQAIRAALDAAPGAEEVSGEPLIVRQASGSDAAAGPRRREPCRCDRHSRARGRASRRTAEADHGGRVAREGVAASGDPCQRRRRRNSDPLVGQHGAEAVAPERGGCRQGAAQGACGADRGRRAPLGHTRQGSDGGQGRPSGTHGSAPRNPHRADLRDRPGLRAGSAARSAPLLGQGRKLPVGRALRHRDQLIPRYFR
ncbi:MAG: DUF882 domain-containing protein [Brucellaceae bacterium]|nr:DUF882 domain-containing protein [Brucellaceae bacterium]